MGDLLFVMANLARHLKVDPETALRRGQCENSPAAFAPSSEAELAPPWQTARGNSDLAEMDRALGRGPKTAGL